MRDSAHQAAAAGLLAAMFFLAGGAALRESVTVDEVAHVGAGLSYLQRLDLRLNEEHPPLGKALAAIPLVILGTHADYSSPQWQLSSNFFYAFINEWIFGDAVLGRWNTWKPTLMWARFPMLILTLLLGWMVYRYATRLGGRWGGLLCLAAYVTTPAFLVFGPLVITDLPVTLFSLIALWQLGEIWAEPSRGRALRFGVALAAALLSKFTGVLLLLAIGVLFLQTRFWPTAAQPVEKRAAKAWRRDRWRCILRGTGWAALLVYVTYFILSWNQPDNALSLIGGGSWAWMIRRPLMPPWLYLRGLLMVFASASRPSFLFGHSYAHGMPYYFPIVFGLKSTLGFLALLAMAAAAAIGGRNRKTPVIPETLRPHWRVLAIGFFTFLTVCLLSRFDISIRHFMMPIVLLIVLLAPLQRLLGRLPAPRIWQGAAALLALASFVPILRAYPYFFPYVNSLSFGHPVYFLVNDSNVSWNEALPEVKRFVERQGLQRIPLDWASLADPTLVVPEAQPWDCQTPSDSDAGQWVGVAAISILENRSCGYLQQYPHQALAGGSFYVFKLPAVIPPAGAPGGPPRPSEYKTIWGMPFDFRPWALDHERQPQLLTAELPTLMKKFQDEWQKQSKK
jgi:hypothetical protein